MRLNRFALGLTAIALIVLMVSTASACQGPGLSPGYWKHNVRVYVEGRGSYSGDPHITATWMQDFAWWIHLNIKPGFTLQWANEIFQNNAYKSMWLTIANWFNAAADRLPYSG